MKVQVTIEIEVPDQTTHVTYDADGFTAWSAAPMLKQLGTVKRHINPSAFFARVGDIPASCQRVWDVMAPTAAPIGGGE